MEKIKLTTYTTPAGTAFYPYLFTPDTKFDANGVYNVKLRLSEKEAKPIIDLINKKKARDSNLSKKQNNVDTNSQKLNLVLPNFKHRYSEILKLRLE